MERTCGRNTEPDSALLAARSASGRFNSLIELRKHHPSFLKQGSPGIRQLDAPRPAMEQLDVKLAFDASDPLTEWRLLHA
jgi:hypothetical protein